MRLIDADELQKKIGEKIDYKIKWTLEPNVYVFRANEIFDMIETAPTVIKCGITSEGLPLMDLTPRPRGKWVPFGQFSIFYKCSQCGNMPLKWGTADDDYLSDFCPYCGAFMEGAKEMRTKP